jgi:small subunit ribosomal protein S13
MAISQVWLPPNKKVEIGLTYIFGIGRMRALDVLKKAQVAEGIKVKDLTEEQASNIRKVLDQEGKVEGDLKKETAMNIKRLMDIGSYRGMRHRRGLPCRERAAYERTYEEGPSWKNGGNQKPLLPRASSRTSSSQGVVRT